MPVACLFHLRQTRQTSAGSKMATIIPDSHDMATGEARLTNVGFWLLESTRTDDVHSELTMTDIPREMHV